MLLTTKIRACLRLRPDRIVIGEVRNAEMLAFLNRQRGFTLIELVIVMIVIGIVLAILAPALNDWLSAMRSAYDDKNRFNNQSIVSALENYAANSTQFGRLPAPYTGNGYTSTIYDPSSSTPGGIALTQALTQSGINLSEINDDGKQAANVRVYQLVAGLTQSVPLYFQSGPLVTLTYDFGAIYLTACPKVGSTCNPTPATGVPGQSPVLNASNYGSWATSGTDSPAEFVSSLPVQKAMLVTTVQRLDKLRDSLVGYLRAQQMQAAGGDITNWYPNDAGSSAAGSRSGASPATNQGCHDGWYSLAGAGVLVLPTVGLAQTEFGQTAWGGPIEYCRDYDPTGTKAPDAQPHYAAIRIFANVSGGGSPDPSVVGNNVILSF